MPVDRGIVKWIIGCSVAAAVFFAIGDSVGQRAMLKGMNVQLDSTQASLAFNRLLDERHWNDLLAKGCVAQAKQALDVAIDKDTELLAGFFKDGLDVAAMKYISDRDPALVEQLKTFKSKYGQSWSEDECKAPLP
jgi:hypothetical protein